MSVPASSARGLFARIVERPDEELDLARAALLIAAEEYPQLPVERYMARLEGLAEEVKDRLDDETAPLVVLRELVHTLYDRNGFKGNRDSYYDPRNLFLNDVLDRGLGIPVSLAIVLLEVGWRLGLPLEGVNFPNHFLVRFHGEQTRILVDPFGDGEIRFEDQAQELLDRIYGGMVRVQDAFLEAASRRQILHTLLTNLKRIYMNVDDHDRALAVVERLLLLQPSAPQEIRDRGRLLARMGRSDEALRELESYLARAPEAADAARIEDLVRELKAPPAGPKAATAPEDEVEPSREGSTDPEDGQQLDDRGGQ